MIPPPPSPPSPPFPPSPSVPPGGLPERFEDLLRSALRARPTPRAVADLAARAMARARTLPAEAAERLVRLHWYAGIGTIGAVFVLVILLAYAGYNLTQTTETQATDVVATTLPAGTAEESSSTALWWAAGGVGALILLTAVWSVRRESPFER